MSCCQEQYYCTLLKSNMPKPSELGQNAKTQGLGPSKHCSMILCVYNPSGYIFKVECLKNNASQGLWQDKRDTSFVDYAYRFADYASYEPSLWFSHIFRHFWKKKTICVTMKLQEVNNAAFSYNWNEGSATKSIRKTKRKPAQSWTNLSK